MDGFLTPISTTYTKSRAQDSPIGIAQDRRNEVSKKHTKPTNPEDVLEILRTQPEYEVLIEALSFLSKPTASFSIYTSSPVSAQITQVLVTEIVSNYWPLLREGSLSDDDNDGSSSRKVTDRTLFLQCLRSLAGVHSIMLRLQALIREEKLGSGGPKRPDLVLNLKIVLEVLCEVLEGEDTARSIWLRASSNANNASKKHYVSHELVSSLARGKVISLAAEAEALAGEARSSTFWVADGQKYSMWLAKSMSAWLKDSKSEEESRVCADMLVRSLTLGYPRLIQQELFKSLLLRRDGDFPAFMRLLQALSPTEREKLFFSLLDHLTASFLDKPGSSSIDKDPVISAVAGLFNKIVTEDTLGKSCLIEWLAGSLGSGPGANVAIRRAALVPLSKDENLLVEVLEKGMVQFGEELYIKHTPMLQQEGLAQVILLCASYVHRLGPRRLHTFMRSRTYLSMVSARLDAPQIRARFLGMVVGEALSSLVDKAESKLDFHMDLTNTDEGKWYKSLATVCDDLGPIDTLLSQEKPEQVRPRQPKAKPKAPPKPKPAPKPVLAKSKLIIEEIDGSGSDEDDIVPYAKLDSDDEDSDDDPTLVQRDKPKGPVYIRTLIAYLRAVEDYDRQKLALEAAPSLIRRKATFGAEVSDHADELATLLVGLHDKFDIEGFHELRLQGIVAVIVAQPGTMAPWFARTFFEGDYSISQRAAILAALGLAARELTGYEQNEYTASASSSFASKRLPERMERLYLEPAGQSSNVPRPGSSLKGLPPTALDTITQSVTSSFLAPMAATAADKLTGPDALKLSTFKAKTTPRPRVRAIPNTTASLIHASFFSPLTARLQHALRSPQARSSGVILQPHLLATFLKTIAVLVHAAGPSTLALPEMTAEAWALVLGVRAHMAGELPVAGAGIAVLAVLVEVNEGDYRALCERQGKEIVETVEWLGSVLRGVRGGDKEEDEVRMLAAGVMIRLQEAVEKYQMLLMGNLV